MLRTSWKCLLILFVLPFGDFEDLDAPSQHEDQLAILQVASHPRSVRYVDEETNDVTTQPSCDQTAEPPIESRFGGGGVGAFKRRQNHFGPPPHGHRGPPHHHFGSQRGPLPPFGPPRGPSHRPFGPHRGPPFGRGHLPFDFRSNHGHGPRDHHYHQLDYDEESYQYHDKPYRNRDWGVHRTQSSEDYTSSEDYSESIEESRTTPVKTTHAPTSPHPDIDVRFGG